MPVISNITVRELNMGANHKQVLQSGLFGWWVGGWVGGLISPGQIQDNGPGVNRRTLTAGMETIVIVSFWHTSVACKIGTSAMECSQCPSTFGPS